MYFVWHKKPKMWQKSPSFFSAGKRRVGGKLKAPSTPPQCFFIMRKQASIFKVSSSHCMSDHKSAEAPMTQNSSGILCNYTLKTGCFNMCFWPRWQLAQLCLCSKISGAELSVAKYHDNCSTLKILYITLHCCFYFCYCLIEGRPFYESCIERPLTWIAHASTILSDLGS